MHYIIDGYNLMFRVLRAGDDLQEQRELIISDLNEKIQLLNLNVTIVFDAHYQYGEESRSLFQSLEIYFTAQGESADEFILKCVKASPNPRQVTVVTSDNKLAWAARRMLAKTESIKEFMSWLNKRYKNRLQKKEQDEESEIAKQLSTFKVVSEEHTKEDEKPPQPGNTAGENFDYYLYEFEKKFRESVAKEPQKKSKPSKIKPSPKSRKPKRIPKTEQPEEPDMQRWQRVFEERDRDKGQESLE